MSKPEAKTLEKTVLPGLTGIKDNLPGLVRLASGTLQYVGPVAAGVATVEELPANPKILGEEEAEVKVKEKQAA